MKDEASGTVLPIRSVEHISEALLRACRTRSEVADRKASIRAHADERFSWSDYGHKVYNSYASQLSQKEEV